MERFVEILGLVVEIFLGVVYEVGGEFYKGVSISLLSKFEAVLVVIFLGCFERGLDFLNYRCFFGF